MSAIMIANKFVERIVASAKAEPLYSGLAAVVALISGWLVNDYRAWKAFGTGGTQPNVLGYCRMTYFRIIYAYHIPSQTNYKTISPEGQSYLKTIPPRAGGRAKIMPRILPQRQFVEPIDPSTRDRLMNLVRRLVNEHPELFELRPSRTEGGTVDGLYIRDEVTTMNSEVRGDPILKKEIAHSHPSENSLHVWVSNPDARKIIEAGWGQRFCLPKAPTGWIMVYAPRNSSEMDIVEDIVKAAVHWATGVAI
ncbi:hypothetical protein PISL3812_07116 [Talaromyces islandicus]|uniref:Luciferase domain-containing protein n=1 Tax=Talaromyces islandicus TaxID=28573 RepID=A0A0U1M3E3_TALIS|nr:hypothetical protein PISL3812_07116 [Talaromyces islandicus]